MADSNTRNAALAPEALRSSVALSGLDFSTTADLERLSDLIGQQRAVDAVRFGIGMRRDGYNLFVLGPAGMGKHTLVRRFLEREAAPASTPSDWCYIYNFEQPDRPRALELPSGRGARLRADMEAFAGELAGAIDATFESDEYRTRLEEINEEFGEREGKALRELGEEAGKENIALLRTPAGFALAPMANGEVINPDEYDKLPQPERDRVGAKIDALRERLHKIIHQVPQWGRERRERLKQLNREFITYAVGQAIHELRERHGDLPQVLEYLEAVRADVIDSADEFRRHAEGQAEAQAGPVERQPPVKRYHVNLAVDNGATRGAPIVFENHPTFQNLIGRVEHFAQFGALLTDFSLIKAGALHRANGGYLMLDALELLAQPFAWEALKRAISAHALEIGSPGEAWSLISTVSLKPQSIPLDVKVVLFGDRPLYYLLYRLDPDFRELFKVAADFEDSMVRDDANEALYARLIATIAAEEKLLPFDRGGVVRAVEHGVRLAGDAGRLSTHMQSLTDLLREADYWARQEARADVGERHVEQALEAQVRRAERVRGEMREEILRGTLLIETAGARAGQINGLSVFQLGNFAFGMPTRITATARLGDGQVIDIQREVKLGGAIHSKGVLILSSFLAARYASDQPLSLSASLTFEQTYGEVEGDSASLAELCALLSSLAAAPIEQRFAVTGSVSQHGEVQAIGGVNEKIEGFFDLCRARGLDGSHGVLIPAANVKHLMLRRDVVQAAREGRFHVYAVDTVDAAIELLTGVAAGTREPDGAFPAGSINDRVAARLHAFAAARQQYAAAARGRGAGERDD